jgi:hypothetical protein
MSSHAFVDFFLYDIDVCLGLLWVCTTLFRAMSKVRSAIAQITNLLDNHLKMSFTKGELI